MVYLHVSLFLLISYYIGRLVLPLSNPLNNKEMTYQVYDYMGRHIMFVYSIEEAEYIINSSPLGSFHWRLVSDDVHTQEGLRYASEEVGYVDQDEEYY